MIAARWSLVLLLFAASTAQAQIMLDVAKITCRQYLLDKTISSNAPTVAAWLSGYFNGTKDNTVLDIGTVRKNKDRVETFCRGHMEMTIVDAAREALGIDK